MLACSQPLLPTHLPALPALPRPAWALQEEVPGVLPGWGIWAGQQREPQWVADAKKKAQQ